MVKELKTEGIEQLEAVLKTLQGQTVFILYSGSLDDSGKSWCADCNTAEPAIKAGMPFVPANATFIHAYVGDRETWKNPTNPFRKLGIKCVQTLEKWGEDKRLEEAQCADIELLKILYEED